MGRGASMLLRVDLLEIVVKTQTVLRGAWDGERALTEIFRVYRDKGLLEAVPTVESAGLPPRR